jgi:type IV pilus assembly protein PilX
MAGNTRDLNIAFQAAEAALRDAERTIFAAGQASNTRPARCAALGACDTVYQPDLLPPLAFQDAGWWDDNAREFAVSGTKDLQEVSADPQYVIEEIAEVGCGSLVVGDDTCNRVFYRVTARSTGTSATTQTVLQSTYAYPFDF